MTYPVPSGVPTSITLHEVRLLQHYAAAAGTVLEIGTLYGFSAIAMALAGAHVTTVDPHEPNDHDREGSWVRFLANVDRHHVPLFSYSLRDTRAYLTPDKGSVTPWHGLIEAWALTDEAVAGIERFGLAFIDGDHAGEAPMRDARIALAHLRAPGYVAFHDVTPRWPGVWRAVHELQDSGELHRLDQVGTLAVYQACDVAVP